MIRWRNPPFICAGSCACCDLERREIIRYIDTKNAARIEEVAGQYRDVCRIGRAFQNVAQVHGIETTQALGRFIVEKPFGNFNAMFAGIGACLARGLNTENVPSPCFGVLQKCARPRSDIQQTPPLRREKVLETFKAIVMCKIGPRAVVAVLQGKTCHVLFGIGAPPGGFKFFRIGQGQDMAKSAHLALDNVIASDAGNSTPFVSLPCNNRFGRSGVH